MPTVNKALNYPIRIISILIISLLLCQNTFAKDNDGAFFGRAATGNWIIGLKVAQIDINLEDFDDADADAVGAIFGYEFDRRLDGGGTSTIELEYLTSDETNLGGFGRYEVDVLSLFFTYRSAGLLYFKVKGGLSYSDFVLETPALDQGFEDTALAGGLGLGYNIGDFGSIELEYSLDSGDNDLGILGLNILFEF